MDTQDIIKELKDLAQLDIDAVRAYEQALDNIDIPNIHDTISQFRDDHIRHIRDLSNAIRNLGGVPPESSPDFKGFFIEGFTAIRSLTGTAGALKAMQTNEKFTNRTYEKALHLDLPVDLRALIQSNYQDEQRHLQYITHAIESKAWDVA